MFFYLKNKRNRWALVIVLGLTFLSLSPCLRGEFLTNWDDEIHLLENPFVRSLSLENIKGIFRQTINEVYLPLTVLSFMIEHHFFEFDPFVYHLNNLILHLLITAFVFVIALQLGLDYKAAALASLLFGIHPMHVESVAWVTERKDVLYGFFYIWAVYHYLRYVDTKALGAYWMTVVLCALSLLAKPMAVSLVLILFLLDWFTRRQFNWRLVAEKIPHMLITVAIAWMTYRFHARIPVTDISQAPLIWVWAFVFYLRTFVFPFVLIPLYALPKPIVLTNPHFGISVVTFIIIVGLLFRARRNRWVVFAFLFYFLSIFFLLRTDIQWDANIVADRFMYLPSVGFCLLFAVYVARRIVFNPNRVLARPNLLSLGIIVLFLWLGIKTYLQTSIWRSNRLLWTYVIEKIGFNDLAYIAFNNRAVSYLNEDKADLGLDDLNRSIQLNPHFYYLPYYNRGTLYMEKGFYPSALRDLTKAIAIRSWFDNAYNNRALVYEAMGEYNKAVTDLFKCISLNPRNAKCYGNRARLYEKIGNDYLAEKDLKRAAELGWYPESE